MQTCTFIHDSDRLIRDGRPSAQLGSGIDVKLVACTVFQVRQCEVGLVGWEGDLHQWAQLAGVVD